MYYVGSGSSARNFFFNYTTTTEIYTLSLHDALPICPATARYISKWLGRMHHHNHYYGQAHILARYCGLDDVHPPRLDRKSTRLNSSHANISYAVFCLKKKNIQPSVPSVAYCKSPYFI